MVRIGERAWRFPWPEPVRREGIAFGRMAWMLLLLGGALLRLVAAAWGRSWSSPLPQSREETGLGLSTGGRWLPLRGKHGARWTGVCRQGVVERMALMGLREPGRSSLPVEPRWDSQDPEGAPMCMGKG